MHCEEPADDHRQSHGVAIPWLWPCAIVILLLAPIGERAHASKWSVSPLGTVVVDTSTVAVSEMSGVTYLGPSPVAGKHRFVAVENVGGKVATIDVEFSLSGSQVSATAEASLQLGQTLDFEGIAYTNSTRDSVFVAFEESPGVREYSISTGALLQSVTTPSIFANRRNNRGFESLARNPAGSLMWTGNEEALTVDGSLASAASGTTVRLLRMNVSGDTVSSSQQFAYSVDPIHIAGLHSQRRSGLSDLVLLPDDTLLSLERSFDALLGSPLYQSRVYEVDPTGATDVSEAPFNTGLIGQSFNSVAKTLLWSGQAGGGLGQNLEGLTLGPRLDSGDWLLVGVVDNSSGADPVSGNTLVSFLLSANPSADFDEDNDIDGIDFLAWQRGYGTTIGAQLSQGDADRDGDVDAADLAIWEGSYAGPAIATVPESASAILAFVAGLAWLSRRPFRREWP